MADRRNSEGNDGPPGRAGGAPGLTRRRALKGGLALGAALGAGALAGCEYIPGQGPPPALYRLTPKSTFPSDLPPADWQLILEAPIANTGLNTTRVALMNAPTQLEYYARTSWTDRAPAMVQTLMIESFENSGKIISVGREAVGLRADLLLKSELREFQAEYWRNPGGPPEVHVTINAKLVWATTRTIVATASFDSKVLATADQIDAIINAFDEALDDVLKDLVTWTLIEGDIVYGDPPSRRRAR